MPVVRWGPPSNNAEQAARDLVSAVMYLHTTFKNEVWLWRGQSDAAYDLEPGMHSRVRAAYGGQADEKHVLRETVYLLNKAREAGIDQVNQTRLPDMALLSTLQHYGAATPLLDVTVDPLVALWMVAFASTDAADSKDRTTGSLFAIRRPSSDLAIPPLDAREYFAKNEPSIAAVLGGNVWWYRPPDVTERLRIQRGSFVLGRLTRANGKTTLPLRLDGSARNWLSDRLENRGRPGNTTKADTDVAIFRVRGSVKPYLRRLLEDRSGLDIATIYPTPWEKPFIEEFSKGFGRDRPIETAPYWAS